jgi:CO/xanthine dehydrogenase FAD-binding subunit
VDATPVRAREAERILVEGGMAAIEEAAASAAAACDPSSDVTASADYRRRMVAVFTRRAVEAAWARARDALEAERDPASTHARSAAQTGTEAA